MTSLEVHFKNFWLSGNTACKQNFFEILAVQSQAWKNVLVFKGIIVEGRKANNNYSRIVIYFFFQMLLLVFVLGCVIPLGCCEMTQDQRRQTMLKNMEETEEKMRQFSNMIERKYHNEMYNFSREGVYSRYTRCMHEHAIVETTNRILAENDRLRQYQLNYLNETCRNLTEVVVTLKGENEDLLARQLQCTDEVANLTKENGHQADELLNLSDFLEKKRSGHNMCSYKPLLACKGADRSLVYTREDLLYAVGMSFGGTIVLFLMMAYLIGIARQQFCCSLNCCKSGVKALNVPNQGEIVTLGGSLADLQHLEEGYRSVPAETRLETEEDFRNTFAPSDYETRSNNGMFADFD